MKSIKNFFLSLSFGFFLLLSVFNFVQLSKDNKSIECSLSSLVKTANAQWEDPKDDGEPVLCAITTGSPSGFLYLVCNWERWSCLYGYEVFLYIDTCYYFG